MSAMSPTMSPSWCSAEVTPHATTTSRATWPTTPNRVRTRTRERPNSRPLPRSIEERHAASAVARHLFLDGIDAIVDRILDLVGRLLHLGTGPIGLALVLEALVVGQVAGGFLDAALGVVVIRFRTHVLLLVCGNLSQRPTDVGRRFR